MGRSDALAFRRLHRSACKIPDHHPRYQRFLITIIVYLLVEQQLSY